MSFIEELEFQCCFCNLRTFACVGIFGFWFYELTNTADSSDNDNITPWTLGVGCYIIIYFTSKSFCLNSVMSLNTRDANNSFIFWFESHSIYNFKNLFGYEFIWRAVVWMYTAVLSNAFPLINAACIWLTQYRVDRNSLINSELNMTFKCTDTQFLIVCIMCYSWGRNLVSNSLLLPFTFKSNVKAVTLLKLVLTTTKWLMVCWLW